MKYSKKIRLLIYGIISVLFIGIGVFWLLRNADPDSSEVVASVGKHMILPPTESPTLAVVEDKSKLESSLKEVAETGDQILFYTRSGTVIVYRPSIDKIVSVQPILIGEKANASLNITVAIVNGSGSEEKLATFIKRLYASYPNVRVVEKTAAPREFPETIVFAKNTDSGIADQLAESLRVKRGIAPLGVSSGSAEVTFIVGAEFDSK